MRFIIIINLSLISLGLYSQEFTYSDSLRGNLSSFRSCYDVIFYDLNLIIDDKNQRIINSYNDFHIEAMNDFQTLQIDLFSNLNILSVEFNNNKLIYTREFNAVFIDFPRVINRNELIEFRVYYDGKPRTAVNPPWDGGFSWDFDENDTPWIGVSCQGLGASSWWPCKDHQSDEPDSMRITCSVRSPLKVISNGNIISDTIIYNDSLDFMSSKSTWFISYPINTYNVTLCIGDYVHINDLYINQDDTLDLDYYVLSYNRERAIEHFKQVKPMLKCFEYYFGRYPFWNDGYALIETPYLGMEHQSAIAYGNNYLPGYDGNTKFITGLDFDYIIVHETGHEWWGNSITTNDIADMWIHEGFCTYSEVLYVECLYGYDTMIEYVNNQKNSVRNDKPIVGPFHVNTRGSSDMYQKASLMLHTLRNLINNDTLWFSIIKGISEDFKYEIVDGIEIINYINNKTGIDFSIFFSQYLYNKDLPVFEYKIQKNGREHTILYRWDAIDKFNMKLLINNGVNDIWLYPNSNWQELSLGNSDIKAFNVRDDLFFIDVKKIK
jgi:aminopeptidase N